MDWNIFEAKRGGSTVTHYLVHNLKEFEEVILESYKKFRDDPDAYLKVSTTMPRHLYQGFLNDETAYCFIFARYSSEFSYDDFVDKNGKFIKRVDFKMFIDDRKFWEICRKKAKERQAKRRKNKNERFNSYVV